MKNTIASRAGGRRGAVVFLVGAALVLFVAMGILAIDLAWVYLQESKLQNAINSAAVAAAARAGSDGSDALTRQAARALASVAGASFSDSDIQIDPLANNRTLVRISRSMPVSLFFGPLFGANSIAVGYETYALANRDVTLLYGSPPAAYAASGVIPLYIPHADLYPVLRDQVKTKSQLESLIFGPDQTFTVGQRYLLKTGQGFKAKIQGLVAMGSSQQGGLVLRGQSRGSNAWREWFEQGGGRGIPVGEVLDTEPGTFQGPVQDGVTFRYSQDPAATFDGKTRSARPLSARMVVVPIANAYLSGGSDAGTGVANLRNIGYIWEGRISVQVIGFGQFFLDDYSTAEGQGVITGTFVDYVGKPPRGQSPGL